MTTKTESLETYKKAIRAQYEIEKEMGIEPPDLEGIYNEKLRMLREAEEEQQSMQQGQHIIYHFKADRPTENAPKDDTSNQ